MEVEPNPYRDNQPALKLDKDTICSFLLALELNGGNVREAARTINITTYPLYARRRSDPAFKKAWDEAVSIGTDELESEAIRRGMDGWNEPVFYKGKQIATVRKYSDQLLLAVLGSRKAAYARKEITVQGGDKPLRHEHSLPSIIRSKLDEVYQQE